MADNTIDDGGLAFPAKRYQAVDMFIDADGATRPTFADVDHPGMTLRDWFAGQADVPWNAVIETLAIKGNKAPTVNELLTYRAELKYIEADAMISARKAGA